MADRISVPERRDGARFPWAESFTGTWHRRSDDDPWRQSEIAGGTVHTLCGRYLDTVHVSEFDPREFRDDERICRVCDIKRVPAKGAQR